MATACFLLVQGHYFGLSQDLCLNAPAHRAFHLFGAGETAGYRRRQGGLGGGGQHDVALVDRALAAGIKSPPTGAGQVDLGPGVQVVDLRGRLHQVIATHESGR